jgi:hypothetical protein
MIIESKLVLLWYKLKQLMFVTLMLCLKHTHLKLLVIFISSREIITASVKKMYQCMVTH